MKNLNFLKILFSPVLIYIKSTKKHRANIPSDFFCFMTRPSGQQGNPSYTNLYLAGKLEIDLQGRKVIGLFGNPDAGDFVFNSRWALTNRTDKSVYTTNANRSAANHSSTGFFISN